MIEQLYRRHATKNETGRRRTVRWVDVSKSRAELAAMMRKQGGGMADVDEIEMPMNDRWTR